MLGRVAKGIWSGEVNLEQAWAGLCTRHDVLHCFGPPVPLVSHILFIALGLLFHRLPISCSEASWLGQAFSCTEFAIVGLPLRRPPRPSPYGVCSTLHLMVHPRQHAIHLVCRWAAPRNFFVHGILFNVDSRVEKPCVASIDFCSGVTGVAVILPFAFLERHGRHASDGRARPIR